MSHISNVLPKEDYKLEVQLDNGSSLTVNLKNKISTMRFCLLSDKDFFQKATTDGNFIHWDNKIEISIHEVFQMAQK